MTDEKSKYEDSSFGLTRTRSGVNPSKWSDDDWTVNDDADDKRVDEPPFPLAGYNRSQRAPLWSSETNSQNETKSSKDSDFHSGLNTSDSTRLRPDEHEENSVGGLDQEEPEMEDRPSDFIGWDRLNQLASLAAKQSMRYTSLSIPYNVLYEVLDSAVELVKQGYDRKETRALAELDFLLTNILFPIFQKWMMTDDFHLQSMGETMRNIESCCGRFITLMCALLKRPDVTIDDLPFEYWWILKAILDFRNKFHSRAMGFARRLAETAMPGEFSEEALVQSCRVFDTHAWMTTLIAWLHQHDGFYLIARFLERNITSRTPMYDVFRYLEFLAISYSGIVANLLTEHFSHILLKVFNNLCEMDEKDYESEKLKCDIKDTPHFKLHALGKGILTYCPRLHERCPTLIKLLDSFKLRFLKRAISESAFNTRMTAMDELFRMLCRRAGNDPLHQCSLNTQELETWIEEQRLVEALYKDNLHHVAYIDRLEKVMGEMFDRELLNESVLNIIWNAQRNKHDAIMRNIHQLTARLVSHFHGTIVNGMFVHLESSWIDGTMKDRVVIIDLLKKVGMDFGNRDEPDNENVIDRVLNFYWKQVHDSSCSAELVKKAFDAIFEVVEEMHEDTERDEKVSRMLFWCAEEVAQPTYDGPDQSFLVGVLELMKRLLMIYPDESDVRSDMDDDRHSGVRYRHSVIHVLERDVKHKHNESFTLVLVGNIQNHMQSLEECEMASTSSGGASDEDDTENNDGIQSPFIEDLEARLNFLQMYVKDVSSIPELVFRILDEDWTVPLWQSVVLSRWSRARDAGYRCFAELVRQTGVFHDSQFITQFFCSRVLDVPTETLSSCGFACFEAFMKRVNVEERKMEFVLPSNVHLLKSSIDNKEFSLAETGLIGEEYLRELVTHGTPAVFTQAIQLMVTLFTCAIRDDLESAAGQIAAKFITWLRDEDVTMADSNEELCAKDIRLRRVLQTLCELVTTNEKDFRYARRQNPPWRKGIQGRSFILKMIIKSDEEKRDEYVVHYAVHENLLLRDLFNREFGCLQLHRNMPSFNFNDPTVWSLSRKTNNGLIRFLASDWHRTLRDLEIDTFQSGLIARTIKYKEELHWPLGKRCEELEREERKLYGVLLSQSHENVERLVRMAENVNLTEQCFRLLANIPLSETFLEKSRILQYLDDPETDFTSVLLQQGKARQVYWLMIVLELILPSTVPHITESLFRMQLRWFRGGGVKTCIDVLSGTHLMQAEPLLRTITVNVVMRMLKFALVVYTTLVSKDDSQPTSLVTRMILCNVHTDTEKSFRDTCEKVALVLDDRVDEHDMRSFAEQTRLTRGQLDNFIKLAYSVMTERSMLSGQSFEQVFETEMKLERDDTQLPKGVMQVLVLLLACNQPLAVQLMCSDLWHQYVRAIAMDDRRLGSHPYEFNDLLVQSLSAFGKAYPDEGVMKSVVDDLYVDVDKADTRQYWDLLAKLVDVWQNDTKRPIPHSRERIISCVHWLMEAQKQSLEQQVHYQDDDTMIGRLRLCHILMRYADVGLKEDLGLRESGPKLIESLLYNFLLPSSRAYAQEQQDQEEAKILEMPRSQTAGEMAVGSHSMYELHQGGSNIPRSSSACALPNRVVAVCGSDDSQKMGFMLLISLVKQSDNNLKLAKQILLDMFYRKASVSQLVWDYQPDNTLREVGNYVGLKNGGATCYMNSIMQQFFMVPDVRNSVLNVEIPQDDASLNKEYPIQMLQALQTVFAHLVGSELEAYTPVEFWNNFRMNGEHMNVHEQQDALEFYNSIVDLVDEGMTKIGSEKVCERIFGGLFADEKICKDCPHKYTREEPFTSISIDVRSHNNLLASLREYVKGDILENDNAYHCELCNKKVTAVKRLSLQKLPPQLVVQLKRFEFDWEKEQPVKYNDYFEFPFELDMYPYTADSLAREDAAAAGHIVEEDNKGMIGECQYRLRGVVVHSGQATGGHYYSYIRSSDDGRWYKLDDTDVSRYDADNEDVKQKWKQRGCFKGSHVRQTPKHTNDKAYTGIPNPNFHTITRFGAETSESGPFSSKRRRARNWWNAYILFYEKVNIVNSPPEWMQTQNVCVSGNVQVPVTTVLSVDAPECSRRSSTGSPVTRLHKHFSTMSLSSRLRAMPPRLELMVRQENTKIMHERNEFSSNFFHFMWSIVHECSLDEPSALHCAQLYSKFLIYTCLRASYELRSEIDHHIRDFKMREMERTSSWVLVLDAVLQYRAPRAWLINNVILDEHITNTYLYESQSELQDARLLYSRMVFRILVNAAQHNDTIGDLLEYPSTHLQRALVNIPRRGHYNEQPAIELLFDIMYAKSRGRNNVEMVHIVSLFHELWPFDGYLYKRMVQRRLLLLMLSALENSPNRVLSDMMIVPFYRVLTNMLRTIDMRPLILKNKKDDKVILPTANPYSLLPEDELIPLNMVPECHVLVELYRTDGRKGLSQLLDQAAYLTIVNCVDAVQSHWYRDAVRFYCWNHLESVKRTLEKTMFWIMTLQMNDVTNENFLDALYLLLMDLMLMKDQNFERGILFEHLIYRVTVFTNSDVTVPNVTSASSSYDQRLIAPDQGLISLLSNSNPARQYKLFRALVVVVETHGDYAVDMFRSVDRLAALMTAVTSTFQMRLERDQRRANIVYDKNRIPSRQDILGRWLEFVEKVSADRMDEEGMSEDDDEDSGVDEREETQSCRHGSMSDSNSNGAPLDLSVSAQRSMSTTPQSGDKRPFPEDDSPSTERRDSKKFNDGSEVPRGGRKFKSESSAPSSKDASTEDGDEAMDQLMLANSQSADDVTRKNKEQPPPAYS